MSQPNAATIALLSLSLMATATHDEGGRSLDQAAGIQSASVNSVAWSMDVQKMGLSGRGVTVAIIDTGIDATHTDLAGAVIDEACFTANFGCPNGESEQFGAGASRDDNGHGTHAAGIIAGRGKKAPEGLARNAKIIAIKVAAADGSTSTEAMVTALRWLATSHPEVAVVNMSLGTTETYAGSCDATSATTVAFRQAADVLRRRGTVIVAAAGNDGQTDRMTAPACVTGFLSVGAVHVEGGSLSANGCTDFKTTADRVACFSNSSTHLDLLAPGAGIVAASLGGGQAKRSGTSQATALVSGAIALLLEGAPGTGHRIETALLATGAAITDSRNGRVTPRIDTRAALTALQMN